AGKYWFGTTPGRRYRVDVGARSPEHGFVPIVRSNTVEVPRGTVAAEVDSDPAYQVGTHQFVQLLAVTGFATDKVLTDLARAESAREEGVETPAAEAPPQYLAAAFSRMPPSVRAAAAHVADGGALSNQEVDALPERIKVVLTNLRTDTTGEIM